MSDTVEFIEKARKVHGDTYDYSKTFYTHSKNRVVIICKLHGEFTQIPNNHLNNHGCPHCSTAVRVKAAVGKWKELRDSGGEHPVWNTSWFIRRAEEKHGGKYTYTKVAYVNKNTPVIIICPLHGEFSQVAKLHLRGRGCHKCARELTGAMLTTPSEEFFNKCKEAHNNFYSYDYSTYKNSSSLLTIHCPIHGEFKQEAGRHKQGRGCWKCRNDTLSLVLSDTQEEFVEKAKTKHNNYYDYSLVKYVDSTSILSILCPVHGEFEQVANYHLSGNGCTKCGNEKKRAENIDTQDEVLAKFKVVHNEAYAYNDVVYTGSKNKVSIECPIHGMFEQTPMDHIVGKGCPVCAGNKSRKEKELCDFLSNYTKAESRVKYNNGEHNRKEIDIYLPEKKIGVEYNGTLWHSEFMSKDAKWHMFTKSKECKENGIRIIHVSDFDNFEIVKKTLLHIIGEYSQVVYARKCKLVFGSSSDTEVAEFFNDNHLQGNATGCKFIGLTYSEQIVAGMLFSNIVSTRGVSNASSAELRRFASSCKVVGGASKLLTNFLRVNNYKSVISFSDNSWFTGGMYEKLGFKLLYSIPPDYRVFKPGHISKPEHKGKFKRSAMKRRNGFDFNPEETEHENCKRNGWYRIYDCGKRKWVLEV